MTNSYGNFYFLTYNYDLACIVFHNYDFGSHNFYFLSHNYDLVSHNVDFSFHNIDILCQTGDFYIVIMIYRSKISDVEEMGSLEKVYVIKSNQMVSLIVFNVDLVAARTNWMKPGKIWTLVSSTDKSWRLLFKSVS